MAKKFSRFERVSVDWLALCREHLRRTPEEHRDDVRSVQVFAAEISRQRKPS
jgi:hypothetical protein